MSLFSTIDLAGKGLEASWLNNSVIANNIANADTPGFKRNKVQFQEVLQQMEQREGLNNMDVKSIEPSVVKDNAGLSYRTDENNVDIDVEMAERAKNELYYNSLISQISHEFRQISVVLGAK